jgi:hypothetical protein
MMQCTVNAATGMAVCVWLCVFYAAAVKLSVCLGLVFSWIFCVMVLVL